MANFTRKAILQTFEEMLNEMYFDKITVSALVARCGISSNTFYYHFRDIYDLLDTWLTEQKNSFLVETEAMQDWNARLKVFLQKLQEKSKVVYHIFDSISRERMERFVFGSVETMFYESVKRRAKEMDVPDEIVKGVSGFYCYSFLGFLIKYIWEGMTVDISDAVDSLSLIFNGVLEYILQRFDGADRGEWICLAP